MARDVESLVLMMSADLRRYEAQLARSEAVAQKRLTAVEAQARKTQKNLESIMARAGQGMVNSLSNSLKGLAPTLAAAFSVSAVTKMADQWTDMTGRMRLAVDAGTDVEGAMARLSDMAVRTYSELENTGEAFFRNADTMKALGYNTGQTLDYVEALNNALVVSGAKNERAESVMNALSKAMAKGSLDGDNLNTVIQSGGRVAQLIAEKLGVTTLELAKLGKEGKITGKVLYDALAGNLPKLRQEADSMTATVGDAFQNLRTKIVQYIGQADQSLSASEKMAWAIEQVGNNLDVVTKLAGALAAVVGTRYVLAMTAGSGATIAAAATNVRYQATLLAMEARQTGVTRATVLSTAAMRGFSAAIAANPVGAVLVAVTALVAGIHYLNRALEDSRKVSDGLTVTTKALDRATQDYTKAANLAAEATGKEAKAAREAAARKRELAVAARESARAKLVEAQATVVQIAAEGRRRIEAERYNTRGDRAGTTNPFGNDRERMHQAQTDAKALQEQIDATNAAIAEADKILRATAPPSSPTPPPGGTNGGRDTSGPTPAELAAQRQMLDLQAEIELLRAQGRSAEADAKQDQVDTLNLTAQYEKAEFANAKAKAEEHVKALAAAREANRAAEEAAELADGEARAMQLTRNFVLDMLDVQEQLALTDRDALDARRQILAIRQAERRAALEAAAADADATEAERAAARTALTNLPALEKNENRALDGSSRGARDAQDIVVDLRGPENAVERAREAYAELERLRQEDLISEQEAALAKAQIDNDLLEKRLSGTRSVLGALESLQNSSNKKLAAMGKAAAIAQATIDGYLAIQKAWSSAPYPFNLPGVAATTIATAANVAAIAGMADGGPVRGVGGPRQDNQLRWLSVGEYVVNAKAAKQNRAMLDAMNYGGGIARMADGGVVGVPNFPNVAALSRPSSSSFSYSPTIDARGADGAAVARLERLMAEERRRLPEVVMGVVGRKAKYRLGKNAEA